MSFQLEKWAQRFEPYGIIVKELILHNNQKSYNAIIQYKHTNKIIKITRLHKFYTAFKKSFTLHKDVLKNTKQYKETDYYVTQYGEVYSTIGVTKKLASHMKNNVEAYMLDHKRIFLKRLVLDTWGTGISEKPLDDSEIINTPVLSTPDHILTQEALKIEFDKMGIVIQEIHKTENGYFEGTINYLHTNIVKTIKDLKDFYYNYRYHSKLHKDVLQGTRQYKNTHLFVTNMGTIYSINGIVKLLNPSKSRKGYPNITLNSGTTPVHHIVLEAWGFPRPSPEHIVRHLNDIPDDNRLENLKWDYTIVNMKDKDINGDKRKELIKRVYETKLFTMEEISILTKIKLESIEGILKTF